MTGRSAAVAYLLWEQVVASSILAAPTKRRLRFARDLASATGPRLGMRASTARLVPRAANRRQDGRVEVVSLGYFAKLSVALRPANVIVPRLSPFPMSRKRKKTMETIGRGTEEGLRVPERSPEPVGRVVKKAPHAASRLSGFLVFLCLAFPGSNFAAPQAPRQAPCQESIPALYDRVSPAVVSITTTSIDPYDTPSRSERQAGSGVIVDETGLILTNSHVVFGRTSITVTLDDGTNVPGQIVGADPLFDIALIRIPHRTSEKLPTAKLGSSDHLVTGDEVYAIGNPFGLEQTLTRGIVSAVNRILPGVSWFAREPLIQTDAAINHGSSGGPLIDRCGDVVGITTAILENARSIGFAIPVSLVKEAMPDLIKNGRVIRPWLGVQGQLVSPELEELLRAPLVDGLLVEVVEPGSPASRLDVRGGSLEVIIGGSPFLLGGDIITAIDGVPVGNPEKLTQALKALKVGTTVRLTLFREQKTRQIEVVIEERPVMKSDIAAQQTLAPMGRELGSLGAGPRRTGRLAF